MTQRGAELDRPDRGDHCVCCPRSRRIVVRTPVGTPAALPAEVRLAITVVLLLIALAAPAKPPSGVEPKADPKRDADAKTDSKANSGATPAVDSRPASEPDSKAGSKAETGKSSKSSKSAKAQKNVPPRDVLPDLSHERVDYWVAAFSRMDDYHKQIAQGFIRKAKYQDLLERRLRERGMPQNLIYLAMEESAFNPEARSGAKAVGIWQLTPGTARSYGLKVTKKVDERRQVEKETEAALRFLLHLHKRFGCWYLAAAAYNTGEHRVAKIMHKTLGRETGRDRDYYRIWPNLPGETRDYVPAIIALNRIGKDPKKYGF